MIKMLQIGTIDAFLSVPVVKDKQTDPNAQAS
jgi:hypothetical protein